MASRNRVDADWSKGPVILTGNWEPLIYLRRLNYGPTDNAELYRKNHTPELVKNAKEAGINLIITHYFKGFGLKGEAEDIREADKLIALAHEAGIKVGGYIGDTFIYETMLLEEPDANDWAQRKADGTPLTYSGTSSFRYRWCRTNPAFMAYMERVLTQAVNSDLDLLHFDNYTNRPEPDSCHCKWCREGFRAYLLEKFTDQERIERFGFADMTHVIPPVFSYPMYIEWNNEVVSNPLLQEWINSKCHILATRLDEIVKFCRRLNDDIVIETNPTGIWGESSPYLRSVDHERILSHSDFFWDESPNPFGVQENGAICTHVRSMKMGEFTNSRVFSYGSTDIRMAEGLAFNRGCLGMPALMQGDTITVVEGDTFATVEDSNYMDYAKLLYARPEVFCESRSMADIAVYRNYPSFAYNTLEPILQAILAEETLLENHIPFDIILNLDFLSHRTLVLPGTETLSQSEVDRIVDYVRGGGNLVITGNSGMYDDWRRERPVNPFGALLAGADQMTLGKGRIARVPTLELPETAPPLSDRVIWDGYYKVVDARYWLQPKDAHTLLNALQWADTKSPGAITVNAPRTTFIEPRVSVDGLSTYIHVINYRHDPAARELVFAISGEFDGKRVVHTVPGQDDRVLPSAFGNGRLYFVVDNSSTYSLISIIPACDDCADPRSIS